MIAFDKYQTIYEEATKLLTEGKVDDLKKMLIASLKTVEDEGVLQTMIDTLQEPVIRENLIKWTSSKGLPLAMVEMLTVKLLRTRDLTTEQKVKFAKDLGEGNYYLDFGAMLKSSEAKKVNPSNFYKIDSQVAEWVWANTKDEKSASLLAASTNIGKGEVPFVILGGLGKPSKGDLEFGSSMIEVKEGGGAAMIPKGMVHPTNFMKDMQTLLKKKLPSSVFAKLPTQLSKAGDSLSKMLSISDKYGFPFGQFCKENNVSVADCKDIMQKFVDMVYPYKFDVKKYISNDYKLDTKRFGKDSFVSNFLQYQKGYGFSHLMYLFSGQKKTPPFIYSMRGKADAEKFYDACGVCDFSGTDAFGRYASFGGMYNVALMKKNLR